MSPNSFRRSARPGRFVARALILVVAIATGCGAPPGGDAVDAGLERQPAMTASGPAGRAEYVAAVDRMRSCLAARHVELINEGWDPVEQLGMLFYFRGIGSSVTDDDVSRASEEWRTANLNQIEETYQRDRPARMAPDLHAAIKKCLTAKGVPATGISDDPYRLEKNVPADALGPCLKDSMAKLYPGITNIYFP